MGRSGRYDILEMFQSLDESTTRFRNAWIGVIDLSTSEEFWVFLPYRVSSVVRAIASSVKLTVRDQSSCATFYP
jgi:hypothetical protein